MVARPRPLVFYMRFGAGLVALMVTLAACGGGGPETARPTLTVTKAGTGSGTVTGAEISCGDDCTGSYAAGSTVTLTAVPAGGSSFRGWSGACSGAVCELRMDGDQTVTATFEATAPQAKVIEGAAADWTAQDAVLRAETYNPEYLILAKSPVAADGSFSLTLPGADGIDAALFPIAGEAICESDEETATGTVTTTPNQLELASVAFYAYPAELPDSDDMSYLGVFFYGSDELPVEVVQLYVATDARVEGSCTFRGNFEDPDTGEEIDYTDIVSYDLSLSAGWNDVIFTYGSRADDIFTLDITTGAPPAGLTWQYLALPPEEPPLPCEDPSAPGCEPIGALGLAAAHSARLRASTPTLLRPTAHELR